MSCKGLIQPIRIHPAALAVLASGFHSDRAKYEMAPMDVVGGPSALSLANTRFWKKVFAGILRHRASGVRGYLFVDLYENLRSGEHIQIWNVTRHEAHAAIRYLLPRLGMYKEYPFDRDFCLAAFYVFVVLLRALKKRGRPRMTYEEARKVLERNAALKSSQRSRMSAHVQSARQRIRKLERFRRAISPEFERAALSEEEERLLCLLEQVLEENSLEFMA